MASVAGTSLPSSDLNSFLFAIVLPHIPTPSKYLFANGPGRRSRTFNFEVKARRVASYTIPESSCSSIDAGPLPTLTGSIDQHAVVTLHPSLYPCDFAGT